MVRVVKSIDPLTVSNETYPKEALKILSPVKPSKVICVGLNYKDHANELKLEIPQTPVLFLKPPTCVIGHMESIIYPEDMSKQVDYEGELAIVIKKECRNVTPDEAKNTYWAIPVQMMSLQETCNPKMDNGQLQNHLTHSCHLALS